MKLKIFKAYFITLLLGFALSEAAYAESDTDREFWEESAAQEFVQWYPQLQEEYIAENGAFKSVEEQEQFKNEVWFYFWNDRRQEIDSILNQPLTAENLLVDVKAVTVSSSVRNRILKSGVPKKAFDRALKKMSLKKVKKKDRMVIIDFTKKATERRFYYINLKSGAVEKHKVAHGKKSGPLGGRATSFSSKSGSNKTPPGFHVTLFRGANLKKWGSAALILEGIESINRNSRRREIIAHGASYVAHGGRSNGCPALEKAVARRLLPHLTNGVLWYHYTGK